jgi:curved DNA-binding protein CbpA
MLGVLPTATDREVHDAWRRRRMEHHPDRASHDRAEFDRLSRLSADINRARDVIVAYRSGGASRVA